MEDLLDMCPNRDLGLRCDCSGAVRVVFAVDSGNVSVDDTAASRWQLLGIRRERLNSELLKGI